MKGWKERERESEKESLYKIYLLIATLETLFNVKITSRLLVRSHARTLLYMYIHACSYTCTHTHTKRNIMPHSNTLGTHTNVCTVARHYRQ